MTLYNTADNPELVQQLTRYCKIQIAKCKMYMLPWKEEWYEQQLVDIYTKPVHFVYDIKKKTIATLLTPVTQFGTIIWKADTNEVAAAIALQEKYPEGFFLAGDGDAFRKLPLYEAVSQASDGESYYPVIAHVGAWTNNPDKICELRDWLENKYLAPIKNWKDKIIFKWGPYKMFSELLYDKELTDYPWQHDKFGHYSYIGFHYTNWENNTDNVNYLLAMVNDKPIGCVCVFDYEDERYGPKHYGLSYIDVAKPYKNNGVAKKMIHELTKHLSADKPLLLSRESKEGAMCHIHECFRREQWPHSALTQDEFDDFSA